MSLAPVGLTPTQLEMAAIIEREFRAAGLPPVLGAAAIVNAWYESRLNPNAVGDGGHSIGLFQLNDRGAGAGMSVEARRDPVQNTRRIIEVVQGSYGAAVRAAAAGGESLERVTQLFTYHIERPADKEKKSAERGAGAARFFPAGIGTTFFSGRVLVGVSLVTLALIGGAYALRSRLNA